MAGTEAVAARYAQAFASVAGSVKLDAGKAQQQMRDFAGTLAGSPRLREVLSDPSLEPAQKLSVLDAVGERIGMYREVRNLVAVVMDHGRMDLLDEILAEYHRIVEQDAGLVEAEVTSARALSEADRQEMEWQISKLAVSRVVVSYREDPGLIGGAVVRIGSTVYDGSVRGQLAQMRRVLAQA